MTLQQIVHSRPGRALIVTGILVLAWQIWLGAQARAKMPSDLQRYVSPRGTVDLRVTLRFPPERFHVLMFQKFGRVSGTVDNGVDLRSIPIGRVREIARFYWVKEITPLPQEGEGP